jgi:hypothetical protein
MPCERLELGQRWCAAGGKGGGLRLAQHAKTDNMANRHCWSYDLLQVQPTGRRLSFRHVEARESRAEITHFADGSQ